MIEEKSRSPIRLVGLVVFIDLIIQVALYNLVSFNNLNLVVLGANILLALSFYFAARKAFAIAFAICTLVTIPLSMVVQLSLLGQHCC